MFRAGLFLFTNGSGGFESVHVGHLHVHQDEIERLFSPGSKRFLPGLGQNHSMTFFLQESHGYSLIHQIVFCNEDLEAPPIFSNSMAREGTSGLIHNQAGEIAWHLQI